MSSSPGDSGRHTDSPSQQTGPGSRPTGPDAQVDALLRGVSTRGMRQPDLAALFSDDVIDRILRDVPCRMTSIQPLVADHRRRMPVDLDAMAAGFDGAVVERAGRTVPRPARFVRSAVRAARDLLSVAIVLALVVAMFSASSLTSRWLSEPTAPLAGTRSRPNFRDREHLAGVRPADARTAPADGRAASGTSADGRAGRARVEPPVSGTPKAAGRSVSETGIAGAAIPGADASAAARVLTDGPDERSIAADGAGVGRRTTSPELRGSPLQGVGAGRSNATAAGESLQVVAGRPSVGRTIPYHRGYDLAFEMTRGEPPFVDPSLTPALAVDQPPLSRRTESFDAVLHLLSAGGGRRERLRQSISRMRVEDVLAALPAPAVAAAEGGSGSAGAGSGRQAALAPRVTLAGAPSLSGRPATRLLEVSVTAPSSPLEQPPTGDLLFVLDGSAAAGADEAWPAVCRGVEDAARRLDPSASITVVVFAERPSVLVRNASPREVIAVRDRLSGIRLRGGGDLHGCMALVRGLMAEGRTEADGSKRTDGPWAPRCVIVAHAGSIARAERDGDPSLAAWRRSQVVARDADASATGDAAVSIGPSADPVVEVVEINAASGATGEDGGRRGASLVDGVGLDSMAIRRSIVDASMGGDALAVLEGCRLEVAFDPAQVAAYRLVGHRQHVVDIASSRSSAIDLAAGECVRVVYEVVLRGRDSRSAAGPPVQEDVVRATCRYRPRGDASESKVVAGISASQLAVDPASADHAGWAVWLAAALAEQVAGSAHVESPLRLRDALRGRFEHAADASGGFTIGGDPTGAASADTMWMLRRLHAIWAAVPLTEEKVRP